MKAYFLFVIKLVTPQKVQKGEEIEVLQNYALVNTSGSGGGGRTRRPPNGRGLMTFMPKTLIYLIFFFARFARDWF